MASLEEMKNNIWFSRFLATKNLSRDDFDNLKDKEPLQKEFEDFVFEKDCDPHISTPEEEDKSLREEVKERLEQAQSLEYHPEGYHINEELDGAAYFCALRRLAISEDEITQENLQKHIKEESNRIATEYFCGLRDFVSGNQSQTEPQKQEKEKLVYFTASIGEMVEKNKSKEDIYQKMFKGKFIPSEAQEKLVSNITAQSNIAPVKKWLKVINYTGKLMDKIQEYEKKYPIVSLAAGLGSSALGVGMPYMAFRMSMVARNVYKEAKKRNFSFSQLVKDSKSRNQLIAAGTSLARIIPGGQFVAIASAVTTVFKEQFREEVKTSAGKTGEALKKIWKSKGKEGWKDLWQHGGKTIALAGTVVTVAGFGADYFFADDMTPEVGTGTDMDGNDVQQPKAVNNIEGGNSQNLGPVGEKPIDWTDHRSYSTPLHEGWDHLPEQPNNIEGTNGAEAEQEGAGVQETNTPEIDVNNLTKEQQHDIEMLFKRDPASANKLLDDGKWHSSAELAKMWEEGKISDEMKLQMTKFAGERFDDAGHFVDANGNIDTKMEDMAKEWTAKQNGNAAQSSGAPKTEPSGVEEIQRQESLNINTPSSLTNSDLKSLDFAEKEIKQPENTEGNESEFSVKKIKIKEDGDVKIVGHGENGREVFHEQKETLNPEKDFNKIKFGKDEITARVDTDSGNGDIKYTISQEGELKNFSAGDKVYSSEELKYVNDKNDFPEMMKEEYNDLLNLKEKAEALHKEQVEVTETPTKEQVLEQTPEQTAERTPEAIAEQAPGQEAEADKTAADSSKTETNSAEDKQEMPNIEQGETHTVETDKGKVSYSIQEGENGYQLSYKGTLEIGAGKEVERQLIGMIHQDENGVYHLGDQVASNEKIILAHATRQAHNLTIDKMVYEDLSARSEAGELSQAEQNAMKGIGEKLDRYNLRETKAGEVQAHTNTAPVVSKGGR